MTRLTREQVEKWRNSDSGSMSETQFRELCDLALRAGEADRKLDAAIKRGDFWCKQASEWDMRESDAQLVREADERADSLEQQLEAMRKEREEARAYAEEDSAIATHSTKRVEMINEWLMDDSGRLMDALFNSHDAHSFWHPIDAAIDARGRGAG